MNSVNKRRIFPEEIKPEVAGRIRLIRGKIDRASFAGMLNISPSYITMIEKGKRLPSPQLTELLCLKFNINLDWLLTGEGEIYEKTLEEKPLIVAEKPAIYEIKEDADLSEILKMLQEHPKDKKLVLKLLRGKKDIKEALEGFEIKKLIEGEG